MHNPLKETPQQNPPSQGGKYKFPLLAAGEGGGSLVQVYVYFQMLR